MFSKSTIFTLALATSSALAQLIIQTPASLIECQPALLSWSGGSAPYYLAAIPGGQPSAAALKDFGMQSGNTYTWNVDLAAGTSLTLKITDATGATNYNQAVTIQGGSSTACFGAAVASTSASASAVMMASSSATTMMSSAMSSMSVASASASKSEVMSSASSGTIGAAAVSSGMSMMKSASLSASSMAGSTTASISRAAQMSGSMSASAASASASNTSGAFATINHLGSTAVVLVLGIMGLSLI